MQATAFTRQRKLPFPLLLSTMLACMSSNVHAELMAFFANLNNQADLVEMVSKQAFSKARQLFSAKAFTLLNQRLLQQATAFIPRWQGLRLVAADASFLCLPARQIGSTQKLNAAVFALYLPGAELTLSAELYPPSVGERQMLFEHLDHVQADDLLLLDQGYPSRWLAAVLSQRQRYFCIRVDQCSYTAAKTLLRSEQTELITTLSAPNKQDALDYECQRIPTQVRFVKTICPNGTIRVVMTNLLDTERYPAAVFSGLYHQRWRIEEAFKRLKHRLHLESVTGDNWLAAQQDFGAKIVADNLHSLCVTTSATTLSTPTDDGCCYKINRAIALSILKRCLPAVLLKKPRAITRLKLALNELCKAVIYFDPHAKKDRPKHPKPHDFTAYKSGV
jgi:hypothetical protein